jgi:hypothetical protein
MMECEYCKSPDVECIQDAKNPKLGNNLYGVIKCHACQQIAFYFVKSKVKMAGNKPTATAKTKVLTRWTTDPISPWLYAQMEEASQATGRELRDYYQGIVLEQFEDHRANYLKQFGIDLGPGRDVNSGCGEHYNAPNVSYVPIDEADRAMRR